MAFHYYQKAPNLQREVGKPQPFPPTKLLIGLLMGKRCSWDALFASLSDEFGAIDYVSDELPFDYTDYYLPEMGTPLTRRFAAVEGLRNPSELAQIKMATNRLEEAGADSKGRRIYNIDPGLLSLHSLVLATTKPHAHRIALHSGIYAEVTLIVRQGTFSPLPWTYPDYASNEYRAVLWAIREHFRRQLKQHQT